MAVAKVLIVISKLVAHDRYGYPKTAATRARPGPIWGDISERAEHGRCRTVPDYTVGNLRHGWAAGDSWLGTGSISLPL